MVKKTFFAGNLFNELTLHHPESPLTALANQPDLYKVGGAWVLWNEPTSNQVVYVKNVKITNQISQATTNLSGNYNIQRITGYTESSMTEDIAANIKLDSNNSALPSQVVCRTRVNTVSGGTTLRAITAMPTCNYLRALGISASKSLGNSKTGMNRALVYTSGYGNASLESIFLVEGQGLAFVPSTVMYPSVYRFQIYFKVGSSSYMVAETMRPYANMVPLVLFNGAGSGVKVEILKIELHEISTDEMCYWALQKIDGVQPTAADKGYGTDVTSTVVPADSADSLPSGIKMYEDCLVNIYGSKSGAIIANPSYRRQVRPAYGKGPGFAGVTMEGITASSELINNSSTPIVLRPGEGLCLFQKNASGLGRYGASVLFQTEAMPSTGGGTKTFASVA
jgi:hypothetical protein